MGAPAWAVAGPRPAWANRPTGWTESAAATKNKGAMRLEKILGFTSTSSKQTAPIRRWVPLAYGPVLMNRQGENCLVERAAPLPSIRGACDVHHPKPVIVGVASGVAHDDHMVARFQRFARDALTSQLSAGAPLNRPTLHDALVVRTFHMDEGMRVPIQELHQVSFDFLGLVLEVGRREGVMGQSPASGDDCSSGEN